MPVPIYRGGDIVARATSTLMAERILQKAFRGHDGTLAVRLWDSETVTLGSDRPQAILIFKRARALRDLFLFRSPFRLAEAYVRGEVEVEGDIYAALEVKEHLRSLALSSGDKIAALAAALLLRDDADSHPTQQSTRAWHSRLTSRNTKSKNRDAIAFHYDVSNEFYRLWLDDQMVYSCAYFEDPAQTLEQAQRNKLDHICRKLRLQPGEQLLDIGCGWSALIRWAAKHYDVRAHGVTLSRNQFLHGQKMIRDEGLQRKVTLELKDYRELRGEGSYDKIASVGMFEHVGLKNLPIYFQTIERLLKPGGLFLNHGITHDENGWKKSLTTRFINRYVFPDGQLDRVSNVQRVMEQSHFEILDVEGLRPHYALTLRHWVARLELRKQEALQHVSDAIYRIWRLYMAGCALEFEAGSIGVYQILAAKRANGQLAVPLTRRDLYVTNDTTELRA